MGRENYIHDPSMIPERKANTEPAGPTGSSETALFYPQPVISGTGQNGPTRFNESNHTLQWTYGAHRPVMNLSSALTLSLAAASWEELVLGLVDQRAF